MGAFKSPRSLCAMTGVGGALHPPVLNSTGPGGVRLTPTLPTLDVNSEQPHVKAAIGPINVYDVVNVCADGDGSADPPPPQEESVNKFPAMRQRAAIARATIQCFA